MQPIRPRISPKVLLELAQKVHEDDPTAKDHPKIHPLLALIQKWTILLIGGAWLVLIAAAPVLLLLLLFGRNFNFTGQWLIAAAWLLCGSFIVAGLLLIAVWFDRFIHSDRPNTSLLLAGMAIVTSTIGGVFLIWQGTNETVPASVTVGVSALLGVLLIGWGVYRLITERQTILIFRLAFFIATLCFGIGLISNSISLKHEALSIAPKDYQALQQLNHLLSPIGWLTLLVSNLGLGGRLNYRWNKRTILQLGLFGVALIVLLLLLLTR